MKKPNPKEYGFTDESGVQEAIAQERQRKSRIRRISVGAFFLVALTSTASMMYLFVALVGMPNSNYEHIGGVLVFVSLFLLLGMSFGALVTLFVHNAAERFLPSSEKYAKARAYLEADQAWRQKLKREYGFSA